ncbi:hypothetical protein SNE40_016242 [Patella caerulea]|uniref:VCBS repeat-containing protein n=1 Tax=Patella caerulea TaxID=87958 RepID=A0AAN8JCY3_PATCE
MNYSTITSLSLVALLGLCILNADASIPKLLGSFKLEHPGFTTVFRNQTGNITTYDLLVSSFNAIPFSTDGAYVVRNIGRYLSNIAAIRPELITSQVTWPNEVAQVPDAVFGTSTISIAGGFLVPFKTNGAIKLADITSQASIKGPFDVTAGSSKEWFYHKVQWVDMDKDGDLDILTCRARKPIFGSSEGQLLWLENPTNHSMQDPWKQHVLGEGPDIFFHHSVLNSSGNPTEFIFTSGYFSKALSVYYLTSGNTWTDPSMVKSRVIDSTIGGVFGVDVVDINQDGVQDLLVTTNNEQGNGGTVLVYTVPSDARLGVYKRYNITRYYTPRKSGMGKGAPGAASMLPTSRNKFHDILLSGDDDGRAYILTSSNTQTWAYNSTVFADVGSGTVGQLSYADIDGDGSIEIFVPAYDVGQISVYSYKN